MSFLGYLVLGATVYVIGTFIHLKKLKPKRQAGVVYTLTHPTIIGLLLGCFVVMFGVSLLMGRFLLGHDGVDWAFVVVNSLVATFIFYFGVNPDEQMKPPH